MKFKGIVATTALGALLVCGAAMPPVRGRSRGTGVSRGGCVGHGTGGWSI